MAHNNLGVALQRLGRFHEASEEYRKALELDPKDTRARTNLRNVERLIALDEKLPAILAKKEQPADDAERLALAQLCYETKKLYAASARLYAEAFATDAKLADDMQQQHRYNAACVAALAGCGQGADAGTLDDPERARLRQQALDWLTADLAFWAQQAESADPKVRAKVQQTLKHWQADTDLAGLRDQAGLAKLPDAEREACQKLWGEVAEVLQRTAGTK
jgi:tetratricopeptide (TPR) repeat protein